MSKMGEIHADLQETINWSLRKIGTPIDWVDVGFAVWETAAIHDLEPDQVLPVVRDLIEEGYRQASFLMEPAEDPDEL